MTTGTLDAYTLHEPLPCRVPGLGSSGTAGVGRKRPASSSGLERKRSGLIILGFTYP